MELKEIPGFSSYYCDKDGNIYTKKPIRNSGVEGPLRRMKPNTNKFGYQKIAMHKSRKYYTRLIHRLILESWAGPGDGLVCNHINGNRSDNRLVNLEWTTNIENERHARQVLGKRLYGQFHPVSKVDASDVVQIRKLRVQGWTYKSIGEKFGIGISQTKRIVDREKWNHVP